MISGCHALLKEISRWESLADLDDLFEVCGPTDPIGSDCDDRVPPDRLRPQPQTPGGSRVSNADAATCFIVMSWAGQSLPDPWCHCRRCLVRPGGQQRPLIEGTDPCRLRNFAILVNDLFVWGSCHSREARHRGRGRSDSGGGRTGGGESALRAQTQSPILSGRSRRPSSSWSRVVCAAVGARETCC